MGWFNYFGLIIIAAILVPNIIYAVKHKEHTTVYHNIKVETLEQLGRYGCIFFMIFNVPHTYFNFWFNHALAVYLSVNGFLCLLYLACWYLLKDKNDKLKALSLSIIPSVIFIFSGLLLLNIPLIVFSIQFAACHIFISCKNSIK